MSWSGPGAFDGVKIVPEIKKEDWKKIPLWKRKSFYTTLLSALFLIAGWLTRDMLSTGLFLTSILIGGYELFGKGFRSLVRLDFNMNTLMTIAILGAAAIGEWREGAVVVFLFALSEALEDFSLEKARHSIRSLMSIAPREAVIRRGGKETKVSVEDIEPGDILIVKPGQKLAMDGIVTAGFSTVNQAAITGESVPVEKNRETKCLPVR